MIKNHSQVVVLKKSAEGSYVPYLTGTLIGIPHPGKKLVIAHCQTATFGATPAGLSSRSKTSLFQSRVIWDVDASGSMIAIRTQGTEYLVKVCEPRKVV